ncbi:MAG: hypothetical protein WCZ23_15540 [Rhodospirillaceae bacterium]
MLARHRMAFVILVSALLPAGGAAAASFECVDAKAPVEHVICNDPILNDLDVRMAEVYAAQRDRARDSQRLWLRERLIACGIPPKGEEPSQTEMWAVAGCLVDQYRARLAALGAPTPEAEASPAPDVHPLCVAAALSGGDEIMLADLAACQAGTRHVPVERAADGALTAYGASMGFPTWISVRPLAVLPTGRQAALVHYNGGGTGTFSSVIAYGGGKMPVVEALVGGGDRCMGGITAAAYEAPDWLVTVSVTAADVGAALDLPEDQTADMPGCAICCYAELEVRVTPDGDGQHVALTREGDPDIRPDDPSRAEACLETTLGLAPRIKAAAFPTLREKFTACMEKVR